MDTAQIADAMASKWKGIDAALTPIIGSRGVDALYKRSLKLSSRTHPWLAGVSEGTPSSVDVAALRSVLAQQSAAEATAGGDAVLQTFYELLATLVGRPLTGRLLGSVWESTSGGIPPQESST